MLKCVLQQESKYNCSYPITTSLREHRYLWLLFSETRAANSPPPPPHVPRINHNRSKQHNDPIRAKSKRPSAGKLATDTKCGKTCSLFQARENLKPFPSAGNVLPVPSAAGNYAAVTTPREIGSRYQARGNKNSLQSTGKCALLTKSRFCF